MPKGDKFIDLGKYFTSCTEDTIELTIDEIEQILGFKLCKSAYEHKEYWYLDNTHSFPDVWINEGFRLVHLDLVNRLASFSRQGGIVQVKAEVLKKREEIVHSNVRHPSINVDYAISKAEQFYSDLGNDENCRYLSWEHCYAHFAKNHSSRLDDDLLDTLCLHLSFYLASWGMYRGSSFLLQKDYQVHKDAIRILLEYKYNTLWGASCEVLTQKENVSLLFSLVDRIKEVYVNKRQNVDGRSSVSDVLVTKILMGTLGCVPAYDQYFVASIRKYDVASGTFNKESIRNLVSFYKANFDKFEQCRANISKRGLEYPPMKILDMCFWQIGYDESLKNDRNAILEEANDSI